MTSRERWGVAVATTLVLAVALGRDGQAGKSTALEDRVTHLEVQLAKLMDDQRDEGVKLTALSQRQDELDERLATLLPSSARWLTLTPGGTLRWEPKLGGQAYVQFVRAGADGLSPVLHLSVDPGGEVETVLRAGDTLELVDDRGSERRIFQLTLHRVARDEQGARRALLSLQAEKKVAE